MYGTFLRNHLGEEVKEESTWVSKLIFSLLFSSYLPVCQLSEFVSESRRFIFFD